MLSNANVFETLFFFFFYLGDEIYQDIFRDFSQMASNNPEKLNRFQQSDSQKS